MQRGAGNDTHDPNMPCLHGRQGLLPSIYFATLNADEAKGGAFGAVAGEGRGRKTIHRRLVITDSPDMYCNLFCNTIDVLSLHLSDVYRESKQDDRTNRAHGTIP